MSDLNLVLGFFSTTWPVIFLYFSSQSGLNLPLKWHLKLNTLEHVTFQDISQRLAELIFHWFVNGFSEDKQQC